MLFDWWFDQIQPEVDRIILVQVRSQSWFENASILYNYMLNGWIGQLIHESVLKYKIELSCFIVAVLAMSIKNFKLWKSVTIYCIALTF